MYQKSTSNYVKSLIYLSLMYLEQICKFEDLYQLESYTFQKMIYSTVWFCPI